MACGCGFWGFRIFHFRPLSRSFLPSSALLGEQGWAGRRREDQWWSDQSELWWPRTFTPSRFELIFLRPCQAYLPRNLLDVLLFLAIARCSLKPIFLPSWGGSKLSTRPNFHLLLQGQPRLHLTTFLQRSDLIVVISLKSGPELIYLARWCCTSGCWTSPIPAGAASTSNTSSTMHSLRLILVFCFQLTGDDADVGLQQVLEDQIQVGQGYGPGLDTQEIEDRLFL